MHKQNRVWLILGFIAVLALVLAACGPKATPAPTEAPPPPPTEVQPAPPTEAPVEEVPTCSTELWTALPGGALEQAYNGELKGKVVTMLGPFTEGDIVRFEQ